MIAFKTFLRGSSRAVGLGVILITGAVGQTPTPILLTVESAYDFYAGHRFAGKLDRPEAVLGYEPGESYADYGEFLG